MPIYDLGKVVGPQGERGIQGPPGEQGIQGPPGPTGAPGEPGAVDYGVVTQAVSAHNTDPASHNDIRLLIEGLTNRLNALANSDDTTLDQMAEVVAYIKDNRDLISQITTNKVNVADIVDNLTTNVANKPLSAAQGVALKALVDAISVPTKVSQLENDKQYLTSYTETDPNVPAWAKAASKPSYTAEEVGADPSGSASAALSEAKDYVDAKCGIKLPDGYTQVEYIESTGTQYIDLAFRPNQNTRVVLDFLQSEETNTTEWSSVFGAWTSPNGFMLVMSNGNNDADIYYGGRTRRSFTKGTRCVLDANKTRWSLDGALWAEMSQQTIDISCNLFLFAYNNAGYPNDLSCTRIYSCKIYDNDTLVRYLVPCINPAGKVGLYDIANGMFYGNAGSGEFVSGSVMAGLPIEQGGTGANNAADARANLGLATENWTFTLEDGTEVTKAVYIG